MANYVVTGALGVLGAAVVTELVDKGHRAFSIDIATTEISDTNGFIAGGVDLSDEDAVNAAFSKGKEVLGGIDGLVNIAGGFLWQTVANADADVWDAMYRMNLRTAVVATRAALRDLHGPGAIVNVGAAAASHPGEGMGPYAASKAGVMALTAALAEELREKRIRVNAVLPSIIDTPANRRAMPDADPSGWVKPAAAAKVIAFLLSDSAEAITGAGIPLSLG